MSVSERDRYFFDLYGYLVVPNVLDDSALAELNEGVDALDLEQIPDKEARDLRFNWVFDHGPPGSHKASFDRPADDSVEELAVDVPVRAGDVIIFTEALVHGGCWRGAGSRRALFYKYASGNWAHRASCSRCRGAAKPRVLEPPEGHQVGAWLRTARRDQPSETVIGPSSR
jgi:hypothetical protein